MTVDLIFWAAGLVGAALIMWTCYEEINRALTRIVSVMGSVVGWSFVVLVWVGGVFLALYILVRFMHWAWYTE
jgi:hypothetical protein